MDKSRWTEPAISAQRNKPMRDRLREFADYMFLEFNKWKAAEPTRRTASQNDFAIYLEVSATSLSNWLHELRPPSPDNLDRIASKLGLDCYWIMGVSPRVPMNPEVLRLFTSFYKLSKRRRKHLEETMLNLLLEEEEDEETKGKFLAA